MTNATNALLAILTPTPSAEGGIGDSARALAQGGGNADADAGTNGGTAFGQMLAQYESRLTPAPAAVSATALSPVQTSSRPLVVAALATTEELSAPVALEQGNVPQLREDIAEIASEVDEKIAPQLVALAQEAQKTPVPALPEIDPSAALSLMPSPIAYTTDAEVAAVAIYEENPVLPVIPDPKDAFGAFPEFSALVAGKAPVAPAPAAVEQTAEAVDVELPEVSLPQYQALAADKAQEVEKISATVEPSGHDVTVHVPEKTAIKAPALMPVQVEEGTKVSEQDDDFSTEEMEAVSPLVAPVGGPLVEVVLPAAAAVQEGGSASQVLPAGAKAPVSLPASPVSDGQGGEARQDASGNGQQQRAPLPDPDFRPVGGAEATKPEATLKPDAAKSDDFAALVADKSATVTAPPVHGTAPTATQQAQDGSNTAPLMKLAHASAHTPVEEQISVHIRKAVDEGVDHISLKLTPPELGKLHIKLEISHDGRAQVLVTADNKDTFDMLQRDARGLQNALNEAGLKADSGSLQFDLREQPGQQQGNAGFEFEQQQGNASGGNGETTPQNGQSAAANVDVASSLHESGVEYNITASEGVDIKV